MTNYIIFISIIWLFFVDKTITLLTKKKNTPSLVPHCPVRRSPFLDGGAEGANEGAEAPPPPPPSPAHISGVVLGASARAPSANPGAPAQQERPHRMDASRPSPASRLQQPGHVPRLRGWGAQDHCQGHGEDSSPRRRRRLQQGDDSIYYHRLTSALF